WSAADYVRASAEIRDPDCFDAGLFDFSPREAEILDPQHRIFLEIAWSALEAAGYDPTRFDGRIGVYGGTGRGHYAINLFANPELVQTIGVQALTLAVAGDTLATRVSYKLDLKGPSVVVQSACSTALLAVHMARQALLKGECDMALAGGVAVGNFQPTGYHYTPGGILSPDGHCRTFDAGAAGSIFSSGAGIVVLKRLAEAVADGDVIHAVIKGSAINNDGALKVGYTAPSEDGQAEVIREALRDAQVDADTVTYVEGHGTATALGDPIEVAALNRVFRESTERTGFCVLGAVKTNIGHTDIAAGAAGLIKTALALEHGLLPPTLHFEKPNPEIDFADSPFRVETELRPWETPDGEPRRAGVSSFGIGGTNVHVVVEEASQPPSGPSRRWQLLVLSAATSSARTAMSERLAAHLSDAADDLADVAFTCQVGRRRLPQRRFVVCRDAADAAQVLAAGAESKRVHDAGEERGERSVVFLLSGLGDQYAGMGRELYDAEPTFRAEVDRCCELLEPILGLDLRELLYPPQEEPAPEEASGVDLRALLGRGARPAAPGPLAETRLAQPAVFVVQVALARLLEEWGVMPAALIGYSLGEYTAAYLAGVLALEDALAVVAARAQLIATVPPGGMLAVPLPAAEVEPLLGEELSLAATNGPEVSVVAGPEEAIDRFAEQLAAQGQACRRLRTRHAFHSHMLRPIAAEFGARVREVELRPPQLPYLSNVTGTWIRPQEATDPDYWVRHLCQPVRFAEGLSELMSDVEPILLEIGPGQALATSARQHPERPAGKLVLATLRDERERQPDQAFLLHTLGRLWLAGIEVDWSGFVRHEQRRRVVLPSYPFERRRFYVEPGEKMAMGRLSARNADLGDWFYLPSWKRTLPPMVTAAAAGRWLLIADDEGLAERVGEVLSASGGEVTLVRAGSEFGRRAEREWEIDPERPEHYETLLDSLVADDGAPDQVVHFRSFTPADGEVPFARRFAAAQTRGLFGLVSLTQALVKQVLADRVVLTVVTNGVQDVERGDELAPEKTTLLGALRVIPQEYAHVTCRNIDVAPAAAGDGWKELAAVLAAELTAAAPEPVVAYRGGSRWIESFEPVHLEAPPEGVGLRRQGVYLVTGGLGRIGLALVEYLARTVEARLVLVSRSPLPPRSTWEETLASSATPPEVGERITRLLALEAAGAEFLVVAADAADRAEMQAAVDQARERFGDLHGVFHLAGVLRDGAMITVDVTDPEVCRRQFLPKVDGVEVLAEVLEPLEPDFCVLFSSLSVVLGGLGFTAYAAANTFMDAFARGRRRDGGTPWISVDWDLWGLNEDEARDGLGRTLAQFEMQPDEALEALRRVLGLRGVPQIVVSTGDLDARIATWVRSPGEQAETSGLSARQRPELSHAYVAPSNETEEGIAEIWQALLGIERVGIYDNFLELGGDSLIGVQLIARLRERFRAQLSVQELFEAPTIAGMAERIAGRDDREDLSRLDQMLREVEEMSQDEVKDELRRHQS
ncbi:MAG: acyltransferase domain-containing protein, partial [bacterium]|nr:acyltransferase domain-containing protein [bacterium]